MEKKALEISYHREIKQNYLMIAAGESLEQSFETRMMTGNTIDGLLKFRIRRVDNHCWFCYEITSRQPLSRLLERQNISASQIRGLLLSIAQTLSKMEDYLLSENQVLLDPEFIYMDPEEFQPGLCLLPGKDGDFAKDFSEFLQYLLGKADHQDREAVVLIYGLYRESLKENYGLDNLLRWLTKEDYPNSEYTKDDNELEKIKEMQNNGHSQTVKEPQSAGRSQTVEQSSTAGQTSKVKGIAGAGILVLIILAVLWLWNGMDGIAHYGWIVAAGSAVMMLLDMVRSIWSKSMKSDRDMLQKESTPQKSSWEIVFAEEEEEPKPQWKPDDIDPGLSRVNRTFVSSELAVKTESTAWIESAVQTESAMLAEQDYQDSPHTVLLWSRNSGNDLRRLVGEAETEETILISYYPFLIGKQENLADFVLQKSTISRLHARLDRRDDAYWLTDLNSTNGTSVNGRLLESNETVKLEVGDLVELADMHFRFQ